MEPPTVEIPDLEVINSSNYTIPVRSIDSQPNKGDGSNPPNLLVEADSNKFQPDKNSTNPTLATRILEPVNKNVDSIEAARVLNVYDSSAIQLKILLNLDLVYEFLSNDIALNDLATRANILSRMKLILDLKSRFLKSETETTLDRDSQLKLSEQIQSEAKHLCRSFHHNIELENVVIAFLDLSKKAGSTRTKPVNQAKFIKNINNLKVICSERLRTLPSEENNRDKYLVKISKRHQQNSTILNKLESQLAEAEELKERELNTLQDELRKLKSDLYQLEQFTEEQIRRTKNEIEKQNQSDSKNSEQRQKKLRLETKDLQLKHSKLLVKNMAEEEQLRRKKANIEKQIEDWIEKYDEEAGKLQAELDQENEEYTELKKQHDKLQVGFETLAVDYNKIMEERRIEHEKRERERIEIEEKTGAAQVIQAFFRSYKVRKSMKKKGKGKGKKGKK